MHAVRQRRDVEREPLDQAGRCVRRRCLECGGADRDHAAVALHPDCGQHAAGIDGPSIHNRAVDFFDREHVGNHRRIQQRGGARQNVLAERRGSAKEGLRTALSRRFRNHGRVTVGQRFRQRRVVGDNHCARAVRNERRGDIVQTVAEHE